MLMMAGYDSGFARETDEVVKAQRVLATEGAKCRKNRPVHDEFSAQPRRECHLSIDSFVLARFVGNSSTGGEGCVPENLGDSTFQRGGSGGAVGVFIRERNDPTQLQEGFGQIMTGHPRTHLGHRVGEIHWVCPEGLHLVERLFVVVRKARAQCRDRRVHSQPRTLLPRYRSELLDRALDERRRHRGTAFGAVEPGVRFSHPHVCYLSSDIRSLRIIAGPPLVLHQNVAGRPITSRFCPRGSS